MVRVNVREVGVYCTVERFDIVFGVFRVKWVISGKNGVLCDDVKNIL